MLMGRTRRTRGFSLLELLIVVAIILIIATIAIPSFLRSRQRSNESAAVANLRTLHNAQATYSLSAGGNYGSLSALVAAGVLDERFGAGAISGYNYSIGVGRFAYTANAVPVASNSGRYGFYMISDGVVRYSILATLAPPGAVGKPVN
jgi:prepilin-type N-terminal cleavage/methylation domain-containing protein